MNSNLQQIINKATEDILGVKQVNASVLAELIIRECANLADTAEPYKADDLILRHFGLTK